MTDRRALKRQYLETKTRAGVYAIRNRVNGRVLLAGSNNAQAAINRHRFQLKYGSHRNRELTRDWQQHGESAFTFEIVDLVDFRDEPDFDVGEELEALVALWREELDVGPAEDYALMRGRP